MRSLLVEIYPPNLFDEGLVAALADLLAARTEGALPPPSTPTTCTSSLPPSISGLLYRAAQEALRNVLSHAQATAVTVRVSDRDHVATLEVVDDGVGFEPDRSDEQCQGGPLRSAAVLPTSSATPADGSVVSSSPGAGYHVAGGGAAQMIRVLIVDDHSVVRRGLEQVLATAEGIEVVGSRERR